MRKYYKATPAGIAYYTEKWHEWQATREIIDKLMEEERDED
jgi:DNA-binding PadR family transcriptional regulator